jgi:glutamine synthetase
VAQRQDRDLHAEADLRRQRLGMHCHQSLWKEGSPLFYDELGYAGLSDTGPLLHRRPAQARAVAAGLHQPDGQLLPPARAGFEAPVNLVYSQRNRSACIRIPITGSNPKAKRIEFRVPDPSSNPTSRSPRC